MQKLTNVLSTIVIAACLLTLSACSDDVETTAQNPAVENAIVYTPSDNRKEIEALKAQIVTLLANEKNVNLTVDERLSALEANVSNIEVAVTKNTGLFESLKIQLSDVGNKVSGFFKPQKKIAAKKTYKRKKRKVAAVTKPRYKVIGIDQWGAYKYVQLMDTQGNLRLLRKSESVDGWEVNKITKKKVVLVNSKGVLMVLVPQA
jgi:hypothetical protein